MRFDIFSAQTDYSVLRFIHPPKPTQEVRLMIRKLLCCVSLAALLSLGVTARARPYLLQSDSGKQSEPTTKSVAGKVASIGNSGTTFALQLDGNDKQVMNFVVGKDTQLKGHVTTGTSVMVEYRPADDGQNVALIITVRS
jgi:hypothetical protein